jgi:hypothetical protein
MKELQEVVSGWSLEIHPRLVDVVRIALILAHIYGTSLERTTSVVLCISRKLRMQVSLCGDVLPQELCQGLFSPRHFLTLDVGCWLWFFSFSGKDHCHLNGVKGCTRDPTALLVVNTNLLAHCGRLKSMTPP